MFFSKYYAAAAIIALTFVATVGALSAQEATQNPMQPCTLTHTGSVMAYANPSEDAAEAGEFPADEPLPLAGVVTGWYALPSAGASAGAVGTILLSWIPVADDLSTSGDCNTLPVFYPLLYSGDICTALTTNDGLSYDSPADDADSEELPGVQVEILAQADGGWMGYDPATNENGARGVERLKWIPQSQIDGTPSGACDSVPLVTPASTQLTSDDSETTLTIDIGDSIVITLAGNPTTGYVWSNMSEAAAGDVAQQQGDYQYTGDEPSAPGGGGQFTFTLVGIAAGDAALSYGYARSFETDVAPAETFTLNVTVSAAGS